MDKYHFRFVIGADGAPFGKDDEATAWLVSCLNVGSHITSESENFLLGGTNCSESHLCMERYAKKLVHDMDIITNKDYQINGLNVKFSFELLPSDMKWLASMGENCQILPTISLHLAMCVWRQKLLSMAL